MNNIIAPQAVQQGGAGLGKRQLTQKFTTLPDRITEQINTLTLEQLEFLGAAEL